MHAEPVLNPTDWTQTSPKVTKRSFTFHVCYILIAAIFHATVFGNLEAATPPVEDAFPP